MRGLSFIKAFFRTRIILAFLVFSPFFNLCLADSNYLFADDHLPLISVNANDIIPVRERYKFNRDSAEMYKKLAIESANLKETIKAIQYIEKYIKTSLNTHIINNEAFDGIRDTEEFGDLVDRYQQNFSFINLFYLFSSIIGFFIVFILNVKRNINNTSVLLISSFVLIHSIFIFHIFLFLSNLQYNYPHTLFMSIIFSFLYGPLIYFYFKKITIQYTFRLIDVVHLIPTAIIITLVLPIYLLPADEKLRIMLEAGEVNQQDFVSYTFLTKLFSLIFYGYLVLRIYFRHISNNPRINFKNSSWQKSIIFLGIAYGFSYALYGLMISDIIPRYDFLYHLQIIAMSVMVLYIGLMAYLRPNLFKSDYFESHLYKYKKSGLTQRYSLELKEQLLILLNEEKIYRKNDINLEELSERLDTTRHNASQVINEHFNLNFFELINKYRIEEAMEILKNKKEEQLNIIDVAYEVGFNNKVTFNKSFKKLLQKTPSQYLQTVR